MLVVRALKLVGFARRSLQGLCSVKVEHMRELFAVFARKDALYYGPALALVVFDIRCPYGSSCPL